jgi:hypothetical protein
VARPRRQTPRAFSLASSVKSRPSNRIPLRKILRKSDARRIRSADRSPVSGSASAFTARRAGAPSVGASSGPGDHPWCACEPGSRASSCVFGYSAETSAS